MPETNETEGAQSQAKGAEKPTASIAPEMSRHATNARIGKRLNLEQAATVTTAFNKAFDSERTATKDIPLDRTSTINSAVLEKQHYELEQHLTELKTGLTHLSEAQGLKRISADKAYDRAKKIFDEKQREIKKALEATDTKIKAANLAKETETALLKANADRLAALQKFKDDILKQEAKFIEIEQKNAAALYLSDLKSLLYNNSDIINPRSTATGALGFANAEGEIVLNPAKRYFTTRHGTLGFIQGATVSIDFSKDKSFGDVLISQVLGSFGLNYVGNVRQDIRDQLMVLKAQGYDEVTINAENKEIAKLTWLEANLMGFKKIDGYQANTLDQEHLVHYTALRDRPMQFNDGLDDLNKESKALSDDTFLLKQFSEGMARGRVAEEDEATLKATLQTELNTAIDNVDSDPAVKEAEKAVMAANAEVEKAATEGEGLEKQLEELRLEIRQGEEELRDKQNAIEEAKQRLIAAEQYRIETESHLQQARDALPRAEQNLQQVREQQQPALAEAEAALRKAQEEVRIEQEQISAKQNEELQKKIGECNQGIEQLAKDRDEKLKVIDEIQNNEINEHDKKYEKSSDKSKQQVERQAILHRNFGKRQQVEAEFAKGKQGIEAKIAALKQETSSSIAQEHEKVRAEKLAEPEKRRQEIMSPITAAEEELKKIQQGIDKLSNGLSRVKADVIELESNLRTARKSAEIAQEKLAEKQQGRAELESTEQEHRNNFKGKEKAAAEANENLAGAKGASQRKNLLRETAKLESDFARFKAAKAQRDKLVKERGDWKEEYDTANNQRLLLAHEGDKRRVTMGPVWGGRWFWGTISPLLGSKKAINELPQQQAADRELLTVDNQRNLGQESERVLADTDNKLYAEAQKLRARAKVLGKKKGLGQGLDDPTDINNTIEQRIESLKGNINADCARAETDLEENSPYLDLGNRRAGPAFGGG